MNTKELSYWILIFILNYIPTIGFHLLLRSCWYKGDNSSTTASMIELFFTIFLLPLYLVVTNYFFAKNFGMPTEAFIVNGVVIVSCIFISTHFHFKNWADSIGSYNNTDDETIAIMNFERTAGIIVSLIGLLIIYFKIRSNIRTEIKENESLHE
jgi:hypothetical protein